MNKLQLIGRPTDEPEVSTHQVKRNNQNVDTTVAKFALAARRKSSKNGEADFIPCVAFDKTATFIEKYVKKGAQIYVEGELHNNNYKNKNGEKVYGFQMIIKEVELLGKKSEDQEAAPQDQEEFKNVEEGETPFNNGDS